MIENILQFIINNCLFYKGFFYMNEYKMYVGGIFFYFNVFFRNDILSSFNFVWVFVCDIYFNIICIQIFDDI